MVFNKKAISPVVATALLLVVAVVAVVGFQTWFNTYQSGLNVQVEQQSQAGSAIRIERLETTQVYLRNAGNENVSLTSISVGPTDCGVTETDVVPNTESYSFNTCSPVVGTSVDVVVVTDNGVFQEKHIVR